MCWPASGQGWGPAGPRAGCGLLSAGWVRRLGDCGFLVSDVRLGQPGGPADVSAGPSSPPSHPRPGVPRSLFPRQPRVHLGRVSPNLLHQHHREAHPESQVPPWRFKGQPQSQEGTSVTLRQAGVATSWTTGQGPRTRVFKGAPASGSGSRRTVPPLSSA